jgi:hypothetical protein
LKVELLKLVSDHEKYNYSYTYSTNIELLKLKLANGRNWKFEGEQWREEEDEE